MQERSPQHCQSSDFIFADAIRKIMMPVLKDFLIFRATQHVDNVIHPKSFFATRHKRETSSLQSSSLPRGSGKDSCHSRNYPQTAPKVAQLNCATAVCTFDIVNHLTQLLTRNPLLLGSGFVQLGTLLS